MSETYSRKIQAVVDIGTSKIVCAIGRFDAQGKKLEILGAKQTASIGLTKGLISDEDALENAILQVVSQAEHEFGEPIKSVVVNISNADVLSEWVRAQQNVEGHVIDFNHLHSLLDIESTLDPDRSFDVIHSEALMLSLDGQKNIENPIGMKGRLLTGVLHVVTAKRSFLRQLRLILKRCHLNVEQFFHTGHASGIGTTSKDERLQGVTVIDIGAGVTNISFFHRDKCIFNDVILVGGNHLTQDLMKAFNLSFSGAERLKNLYGGLIISPADRQEIIQLNAPGQKSRSISKSDLMEVLFYRVQEIFFLVKQKVEAQNLESTAGRRYVLTGGGSQVPGIRELGNRLLEKPLRLGRPLNVVGYTPLVEGAPFATAAGLLYGGLLENRQRAKKEKSYLSRLGTWIRENL